MHLGQENSLRNAGSSALRSMAAVVRGAFLSLADEGVTATRAVKGLAVGEIMLQTLNLLPSIQDILYLAKETL